MFSLSLSFSLSLTHTSPAIVDGYLPMPIDGASLVDMVRIHTYYICMDFQA